jgi:hypothetical protein
MMNATGVPAADKSPREEWCLDVAWRARRRCADIDQPAARDEYREGAGTSRTMRIAEECAFAMMLFFALISRSGACGTKNGGALPARESLRRSPRLSDALHVQRHLRLRGGGAASRSEALVGGELLGPFMEDESAEMALRTELGLGEFNEEEYARDDLPSFAGSQSNTTGNVSGARIEYLLSPEYLHAAVARSKPAVHFVRGGLDRGDKPGTRDGEAGLHLLSLSNGIALNLKCLPSLTGSASGSGLQPENAVSQGTATGGLGREESADDPAMAVAGTFQDRVRIQLVVHGGSALLGAQVRSDMVSAALHTWVGGGVTNCSDEALQTYMRQHRLEIITSSDPEKAIVQLECEREEVPRAFELVHALVSAPQWSAKRLEQVKAELLRRQERLQGVLEHHTGLQALRVLAHKAPFLDPTVAAVANMTLADAQGIVWELLARGLLEVLVVGDVSVASVSASARTYLATIPPPCDGAGWGEAGGRMCLSGSRAPVRGDMQGEGRGGVGGVARGLLGKMHALEFTLGNERRGTTVSIPGARIGAHVVLIAPTVNRWGFPATRGDTREDEAAGTMRRFHALPDWQTNLAGARVNGALLVSRCIGVALEASAVRLRAALASARAHVLGLRWYPFEVLGGGLVTCELSPQAESLEEAVAAAQRVLEEVWGEGITQEELDASRDKIVGMLEDAREASPDYWLACLLLHLQTGLTPKGPGDVCQHVANSYESLSLSDVNTVGSGTAPAPALAHNPNP